MIHFLGIGGFLNWRHTQDMFDSTRNTGQTGATSQEATARLDVKGQGWFIQHEDVNTLQNHQDESTSSGKITIKYN